MVPATRCIQTRSYQTMHGCDAPLVSDTHHSERESSTEYPHLQPPPLLLLQIPPRRRQTAPNSAVVQRAPASLGYEQSPKPA